MSTKFLSRGLWPQLTRAARLSREQCAVAVAYFAAGASRLLPLRRGSSLVVDASERAVASGQTCPDDLLRMVKRGVDVFSVLNLHAKVFVMGRAAYIGSPNVSKRSASGLIEAAVRTTDRNAVRAAREFVRGQCLHQLTPSVLKRLAKLYRPPLVPGGGPQTDRPKGTSTRPTLPRLLLAQLQLESWTDEDQALHESGLVVAKRRREHPRSFVVESFRLTGKCKFLKGDVVVQVTDEGGGNVLVEPPGNVLYVRSRGVGRWRVSFVYLERPNRRRRQVKQLARALGCTQKSLRRDGVIRDASLAQGLLNAWATSR